MIAHVTSDGSSAVECLLPKEKVEGSTPFHRSKYARHITFYEARM